MCLRTAARAILLAALSCVFAVAAKPSGALAPDKRSLNASVVQTPAPRFVIISQFDFEAEVWYGIPEFNVLERNITLTNLSPLYPQLHCTEDYDICQIVLGEGEINAASSMSALLLGSGFDFKRTYFMTAGIAGVSPEVATLGSVCFARYAVQVGLQYEIDAREIPANFSTGYVPQGATAPGQYPTTIYGSELFEVNTALRQLAVGFASTAKLNDSTTAQAYRANYASSIYAAGASPPSVVKCDVVTTDVFYSGNLLCEAMNNYTLLLTNNSGVYCTTVQEDNATLEVLVRAAKGGLIDFARVILMRTGSDFDRPYLGEPATVNLFWVDPGGFEPSLMNIYLAGIKVVEGILGQWDSVFEKGVTPTNYIGDILATLGGTPDFGSGQLAKRDAPLAQSQADKVKRKILQRRVLKATV